LDFDIDRCRLIRAQPLNPPFLMNTVQIKMYIISFQIILQL
jgi:hypothetical protein